MREEIEPEETLLQSLMNQTAREWIETIAGSLLSIGCIIGICALVALYGRG